MCICSNILVVKHVCEMWEFFSHFLTPLACMFQTHINCMCIQRLGLCKEATKNITSCYCLHTDSYLDCSQVTIMCTYVLMFSVLPHLQETHVHSPLYTASNMGRIEIVDALLKNGADPNLACTVCELVSISCTNTLF